MRSKVLGLQKTTKLLFPRKPSSRFDTFILTLPAEYKIIILNNEITNQYIIYIYNNTYSFIINISKAGILFFKFYVDTNTIYIRFGDCYNLFVTSKTTLLKNLRIFSSMFVCKLRVRGRLFRIYKRNKFRDLFYRFGYGHKLRVYTEGFYTKFVRKKRIRMFGYIYDELINKLHEAKSWFPLGIYTERGIHIINKRWKAKEGKVTKFY